MAVSLSWRLTYMGRKIRIMLLSVSNGFWQWKHYHRCSTLDMCFALETLTYTGRRQPDFMWRGQESAPPPRWYRTHVWVSLNKLVWSLFLPQFLPPSWLHGDMKQLVLAKLCTWQVLISSFLFTSSLRTCNIMPWTAAKARGQIYISQINLRETHSKSLLIHWHLVSSVKVLNNGKSINWIIYLMSFTKCLTYTRHTVFLEFRIPGK